MSDQLEQLDTTGFRFESTSLRAERLRASFGDGYGAAARTGSSEGLRGWKMKVAVLPNTDDAPEIQDVNGEWKTRALYLWEFWKRHKLEKDCEIFIVRDPMDRALYFAEFVEDELTFETLTSSLLSTGLELRQRRVPGQELPAGPDAEYNPQQI